MVFPLAGQGPLIGITELRSATFPAVAAKLVEPVMSGDGNGEPDEPPEAS
jgi:hypothetical protein